MARVTGRHVDFHGNDVVPPDFEFNGEQDWERFWESRKDTTCFDPCLIHYFTGSMEDWVIRQRRPNYGWARDVKCFNSYTSDIEDRRMAIYVDEVRALLATATQ